MNVQSLDEAYWERRKSGRLSSTIDALGKALQDRRQADMVSLQDVRGWVEQVAGGQFEPIDKCDPDWTLVLCAIRDCADADSRDALGRLVLRVIDAAGPEMLNVRSRRRFRFNLVSLRAMHENWRDWVRPVETWTPELNLENDEIVLDLARHLFARWPVPEFLNHVWSEHVRDTSEGRALFMHIGAGRSLREIDQPYRMTRRTAHEFMQAPTHLSIMQARAWADVAALGGSRDQRFLMIRSALGYGLLKRPEQREFWLSVVRFYVALPISALENLVEVIDFLEVRKFGGRDGSVRSDAPQPGLSMHGRTLEGLNKEVEAWHVSLALAEKFDRVPKAPFTPSGRPGLDLRAKSDDLLDPRGGWCIREIRNAFELFEEGKAMRNCVLSYAELCISGARSIWSMAWINEAGEASRCLTIELSRNGRIGQVMGPANRRPKASELRVVQQWVEAAGLSWQYMPAALRPRQPANRPVRTPAPKT